MVSPMAVRRHGPSTIFACLVAVLLSFEASALEAAAKDDGSTISQREASCRSFLGYWAQRGAVNLGIVCRQGYSEAACSAAEESLGGDWPEDGEKAPQAVVDTACHAMEKKLMSRRGFMLNQQSAVVYSKRGVASRETRLRRRRELPDWVKDAPVMWEDPEASESPYPLDMAPSTWDGPRLTDASEKQLYDWGGVMPSATLAPVAPVLISPADGGTGAETDPVSLPGTAESVAEVTAGPSPF
mmetsp:Transcript_47690/g.103727  ORF Transcript_47690/g.103727 Transcript_47690/m.103727 type:complete len:242 (-) Transcript_47690:47-772(-)|eukprot:CAMPEP_0170600570 /NCGR_PEP_ID=MMETSP0224-20130122/17404_1 /TAXON_ID=285029 /ORGANISM="Togula jolla, Strain CCCM 725" /LENGTH=241 /DNA_ID=CAMNT_0010925303 /DNA_START=65 /DNA_END=790 /DNA_ORIENTATION=+